MTRPAAPALVLVLGAAATGGACGEPVTVTVHARAAALVAVDVGDGWEARTPGDVTFDEPDGLYRIAVTCRADVGVTTFVLAAPGDRTEYDLDCTGDEKVEVTYDVTGDVHGIFLGYSAVYGSGRSALVAPGTYDLVATTADVSGNALRAQVIRDVTITGPTHLAVDVAAVGVDLEPFSWRSTGGTGAYQQVYGTTAGGTWFQLASDPPRRLPASVLVAGDEPLLAVTARLRPGHLTWAAAPAEGAEVTVALPAWDGMATFETAPPRATLSALDGWEAVTVILEQDNVYGVPRWTFSTTPRALAAGATVALPDLPPGWQPRWSVDPAGYHRWIARLWRHRVGGGAEEVSAFAGVYDPMNRSADARPWAAPPTERGRALSR